MKLLRDKYLTPDEFKRLIYQAKVRRHKNAKRDYALLVTGGLGGLRAKEIVSLRLADLFLKEKPPFIKVTNAKRRNTGTRYSQDDLPVPNRCVVALKQYIASIPTEDRKPWRRVFPITVRAAQKVFKRYADLAGLNPRYSIHSLRHFRGVQVYEATQDIQLTKEALRHATITSTQVYVQLLDKSKIAEVDLEEEDE